MNLGQTQCPSQTKLFLLVNHALVLEVAGHWCPAACIGLGDPLFIRVPKLWFCGHPKRKFNNSASFFNGLKVSKSIEWYLVSCSPAGRKESFVCKIALTWWGVRTFRLYPEVNFVAFSVNIATALRQYGYSAATSNFFEKHTTGQGSCAGL